MTDVAALRGGLPVLRARSGANSEDPCSAIKIVKRRNGHAWVFDVVSARTRNHERESVILTAQPRNWREIVRAALLKATGSKASECGEQT